jgi:hypothetical protein
MKNHFARPSKLRNTTCKQNNLNHFVLALPILIFLENGSSINDVTIKVVVPCLLSDGEEIVGKKFDFIYE